MIEFIGRGLMAPDGLPRVALHGSAIKVDLLTRDHRQHVVALVCFPDDDCLSPLDTKLVWATWSRSE